MAPGSGSSRSSAWTSCSLPSETWMKLGILPRKSSRVCIFTAALVVRKCAQGKTDRHRSIVVESRADGIGQVQAKVLVGVELPCLDNQSLGQIRVDAPVARFVGVRQRRAPDRFAQTHVVELRRLDGQAGLDIAQALPVGQLGKRHGPILLGAGENPHPMVAAVTG